MHLTADLNRSPKMELNFNGFKRETQTFVAFSTLTHTGYVRPVENWQNLPHQYFQSISTELKMKTIGALAKYWTVWLLLLRTINVWRLNQETTHKGLFTQSNV